MNYLPNKNIEKQMDWKYYNHAVIPNTPPHIAPNLSPIKDGSIWGIDGKFPFFARWTSDFDCKEETDWYYIIKDSEYEINSLKSNRRKNITKGKKYFYTKLIKPKDYKNDIADICEEAFLSYPILYRSNYSKEKYIKKIENGELDDFITIGVFFSKTNSLVGYMTFKEYGSYIEAYQQKVKPSYEKYCVNFALLDGALSFFNKKIKEEKKYIVNGCTNLIHKTGIFDVLIIYFGYRKAFCKLNIVYRPILRLFIPILYLFRRTFNHFKAKHSLIYKINAVLEMESIARKCRYM